MLVPRENPGSLKTQRCCIKYLLNVVPHPQDAFFACGLFPGSVGSLCLMISGGSLATPKLALPSPEPYLRMLPSKSAISSRPTSAYVRGSPKKSPSRSLWLISGNPRRPERIPIELRPHNSPGRKAGHGGRICLGKAHFAQRMGKNSTERQIQAKLYNIFIIYIPRPSAFSSDGLEYAW